jgi:hypothetical protein
LARRERRAALIATVCLLAVLATSTVIRTLAWQRVWEGERRVLAAVPTEKMHTIHRDALVVVRGLPTVDDVQVFYSFWAMSAAVHRWATDPWPEELTFLPVRDSAAPFWDGKFILGASGGPLIEASEVWVWDWPTGAVSQVSGPGPL